MRRRNVVLDRMAELNVITRKRAAKVKEQGLGLDVQPAQNGCVFSRAPFFCDYVINVLMKDESLGKTPEERKQAAPLRWAHHPHHASTCATRRRPTSRSARTSSRPTRRIGGLAMVEPGTGNVKALAQSRPMGRDKPKGETYLNYVVPTEVRRLRRVPGGLDLQGVRAGHGPGQGHRPAAPR